MTTDVEALAARLQRLEDLEAIRQVFVDYGFYLDHGRFDDYASLFADDGEILMGPMGRAKGPDAIKAMMAKTLEGRVGMSFHIITNPIIELDGDTATSDVTWVVANRGADGKPVVGMYGRHKDTLVRTDKGWKFRRREGHIDMPSKYSN